MSTAVPLLAILMFSLVHGIRRFGAPAAFVSVPVAVHILSVLLG